MSGAAHRDRAPPRGTIARGAGAALRAPALAPRAGAAAEAIPRLAVRPDPLPLSFAQQRLWLLDRLNPGDPASTCPPSWDRGAPGTPRPCGRPWKGWRASRVAAHHLRRAGRPGGADRGLFPRHPLAGRGPLGTGGGSPPGRGGEDRRRRGPPPLRPRGRTAAARPPVAAGARAARPGPQPPPHRDRRLVPGRDDRRDGGPLRGVAGGGPPRCPSCRSSTPTSPSGSGSGCAASGWRAQLAYWRGRLAGRRRRCDCPPTGRARPAAAPPAPAGTCAVGAAAAERLQAFARPSGPRRSWSCSPPSRPCSAASRARTTSPSARPWPTATAPRPRADRLFRQHPGAARRPDGGPHVPRAAGPRARGRPGRLRPPGPALRDAGRGAAPGARPQPHTAVPGLVRAAERADARARHGRPRHPPRGDTPRRRQVRPQPGAGRAARGGGFTAPWSTAPSCSMAPRPRVSPASSRPCWRGPGGPGPAPVRTAAP